MLYVAVYQYHLQCQQYWCWVAAVYPRLPRPDDRRGNKNLGQRFANGQNNNNIILSYFYWEPALLFVLLGVALLPLYYFFCSDRIDTLMCSQVQYHYEVFCYVCLLSINYIIQPTVLRTTYTVMCFKSRYGTVVRNNLWQYVLLDWILHSVPL